MRLLLAAILAAALGWSAYWWFGAGGEQAAIEAWFATRDTRSAETIATRGFPNRFDTAIVAPSLDLGPVTWSAPALQLLRLSYQPHRYIVAFAQAQTLATDTETLTFTSAEARGDAQLGDGALAGANAIFTEARLRSSDGWAVTAERLQLASRATADGYEVFLDAPALSRDGVTTSLKITGTVRFQDGVPVGHVTVETDDGDALSTLLQGTGYTILAYGALLFRDGQTLADEIPIGAAPRLP